jgi:hypothetical protein
MGNYYTVKEGQICRNIKAADPSLEDWVNIKSACKIKDRFYHAIYELIDKTIEAQQKESGAIIINSVKIPYRIIRNRWKFIRITGKDRWRILASGKYSTSEEALKKRKPTKCVWCGSPRACFPGANGLIYCNSKCEDFSVRFIKRSAYA